MLLNSSQLCRYDIMLKCWEERGEKRPTFTEIVSHYHNGLIPGTAKAEEGTDGYVLLGSEEHSSTAERPDPSREENSAKCLSDTSVMDVTIVNNLCEDAAPSAGGIAFHVTLLHNQKGSEDSAIIAAQPDKECYVEMNGLSNVLVNQAAGEYDGVSEEGSHVTSSADHVISDVDHVTPVEHELDYIVMQKAEPAKRIN